MNSHYSSYAGKKYLILAKNTNCLVKKKEKKQLGFLPEQRHCVFYGVECWTGVLEWSGVEADFGVKNFAPRHNRT